MNELSAFESRLAAGLEAYAGPRRSIDATAIARAAASRAPVRRSVLSRFSAMIGQGATVLGRPGDRAEGRSARPLVVLIAVALIIALAFGAIAVGSGLLQVPSVLPPPQTPSPIPLSTPEAEESAQAIPSSSAERSIGQPLGLVVYNVKQRIQPRPADCTIPSHASCNVQRIWIANADGRGAHDLLPDAPGGQYALGWTPDGSRILYVDSSCRLGFTDAEGSIVETLPLETRYPFYPDPCDHPDSPGGYVDLGNGIAFSPDGARLAYVVSEPGNNGGTLTTVAIYDLETREVTRLESTRANDTGTCVTGNEWHAESPMWSVDGTQLIFGRAGCQGGVLAVNADGTGLRVIVPADARGGPGNPRLSPDGSLIAYHFGHADPYPLHFDIYVVNLDGTGVRQLTNDGLSAFPEWTADGRIAFGRFPDRTGGEPSEVWIMDADGGALVQLGPVTWPSYPESILAYLTGPKCADCPYAYPSDNPAGLPQPLP